MGYTRIYPVSKETAPKINAVIFCALQSIFGGSLIGHVYHHTVVVGLYV